MAQAEVEDRETPGAYHDIAFGMRDSDRHFVISTTRPELLAACVGVVAHPADARFKDLFGKEAVTPLFHVPVPVFPTELADPQKGTGILMVCTFGDATDVRWWREQKLRLRQIIGRNGRLEPLEFGSEGWESLNAEAANRVYGELAGKNVEQARKAVVELLRDPASASGKGAGAPLQGEPRPITHPVKYFEKGDRPLEFVSSRQWFVRLMDKKEQLLRNGERIQWHPGFMRARYANWTEGLQLDWCISRQRYFGVPFPIWYRLDAHGKLDSREPLLADPGSLPVDPMLDTPTGFEESQRDQPGGFTGEEDVFDTWFTSSLTPQIGSHWLLDPERHKKLFPADIRPQSHEIIRTWAFYTIVKAMLHEDTIPWEHVVISGWILDPDRKKMSKSKGNVVTLIDLLDKYTADGARYWAASARLGTDTAFDESVLKAGRRLVTKLFNAGEFVLAQQGEVHPISNELDRAFVQRLRGLCERTTRYMETFEYAGSLAETERFFWTNFTDTYLELAKARARGDNQASALDRGSAISALRLGLNVLLRLFAPMLPYISEEVWSWAFAEESGHRFIHRAPWPGDADFADVSAPDSERSFETAVSSLSTVNKRKTEAGVSIGRPVERLVVAASPATVQTLRPVAGDVFAAVRAAHWEVVEKAALNDGAFEIMEAVFEEKS